ncbi:MAG: nitroreductase family protein [Bacteroidota bacterium]
MIKQITNRVKHYKNAIVKERMLAICHKSPRLSSLYYYLFDTSFDREHQAVLFGKMKHVEESKSSKKNYFLLVRNIHRIEKGLIMRPKRPVFAKDYIKETIDNFVNVWNGNELEGNPQLKWFYDVLSDYFSSASSDPFVLSQYERFKKTVESEPTKEEAFCSRSVPYKRLESGFDISFDDFYKLSKHRRSVRWFLDKKVERERIDKAIMVANQSPSACNRQPFTFHIFDDPQMVKEVVNYPMGTVGYGHSIPVLVVVVGNLDAYFDERDRHLIYIDGSLAAMSFMLALETLELSSVSINWPDIEEREMKMEQFLKLEKHQRPIMCMGVGYPDPEGLVAFSQKRSLDHIRQYNN